MTARLRERLAGVAPRAPWRLKDLLPGAATVAVAAVLGVYATRSPGYALLIAGSAVIGGIVVFVGGRPDRWREHRWIPWAWIALMLSPNLRFEGGHVLDVSASASAPANIVQVLLYSAVGALVLRSRRLLIAEHPVPVHKTVLVLWPALAVLSTVWSPISVLTLVRSLQLVVVVALAYLCVRVWLAYPETGARLWRTTLRLFVQLTTILVPIGFVAGPHWETGRFSWPGFHPITASTYLVLAILILVGYGRIELGFSRTGAVVRVLLFGAALYLGQTRSALLALAVGVAVLLWFEGRRRPAARYLGLFHYAAAAGVVLLVAFGAMVDYFERGAGMEQVATLNGRIQLWDVAIDLLGDGAAWLTGFGYGAARILLPLHVDWRAGSAHSSWVELLLSIGIPGVVLGAGAVLFLLRGLSLGGTLTSAAGNASLIAALAVLSVATEVLVMPGVGFGLLALLHVPVLTRLSEWRAHAVKEARTRNQPEALVPSHAGR
jgi:O-antigen ligase